LTGSAAYRNATLADVYSIGLSLARIAPRRVFCAAVPRFDEPDESQPVVA
jgi:hypothetical protein